MGGFWVALPLGDSGFSLPRMLGCLTMTRLYYSIFQQLSAADQPRKLFYKCFFAVVVRAVVPVAVAGGKSPWQPLHNELEHRRKWPFLLQFHDSEFESEVIAMSQEPYKHTPSSSHILNGTGIYKHSNIYKSQEECSLTRGTLDLMVFKVFIFMKIYKSLYNKNKT